MNALKFKESVTHMKHLRTGYPKEDVLKNQYIYDDSIAAYLAGYSRYYLKEKVIGFLETDSADKAEQSLLNGDLQQAVHFARKLSSSR